MISLKSTRALKIKIAMENMKLNHIVKSRRSVLFGAMAALLALSFAGASGAAPNPQKTGDKMKSPVSKETATFAAGCFWSMEAIFKQLKGVEKVEPGYSGGKLAKPSYEQVDRKSVV